MMPKSVLAFFVFAGSFVTSASVKPPPCAGDCSIAPVPVVVVGTVKISSGDDAGVAVLPEGVGRPESLPFVVTPLGGQ